MTKVMQTVTGAGGHEFTLETPFKNKTGTYTVMVEFNRGRMPVRDRNRKTAIEKAEAMGHVLIAQAIAFSWVPAYKSQEAWR